MIESWAEEFRIENYRASESGDQILIQFERPERIEQVLAPRTAELQKTNTLYGLQNRYAHYNDDPENWPVENIQEDLLTARRIDEDSEAPEGMLWPENALVAVAAAAVRAYALGLAPLERSDLSWAADAVMWAAENPQVDGMSFSGTMFSMGAARAAAATAPLLLLKQFDEMSLDQERVERYLRSLATSMFDEVRAIFVKGCDPAWDATCDINQATGRCRRHQPAWEAAVAGLATLCWAHGTSRLNGGDPVRSRPPSIRHCRMSLMRVCSSTTFGCHSHAWWMPETLRASTARWKTSGHLCGTPIEEGWLTGGRRGKTTIRISLMTRSLDG